MSEIGLFEAIYSQRALRRLKPDPLPEEVIQRLLDAAVHAPSGSNNQPWRFIVIRDVQLKARVAAHYRDAWQRYTAEQPTASEDPSRLRSAGRHLAEHMQEAPVLILVCRVDDGAHSSVASVYASIYPAVQNLLLAARGLGLGATLTTLHKMHEEEIKELLGIPADVETCALIPIGYPVGHYGPTRRRPVAEVTYWERWGASRDGR